MNLSFWRKKQRKESQKSVDKIIAHRNFNASTIDRLSSDWTTTALPIDQVLRTNLVPLRARSRDLVMNNDYARRFMSLIRRHVVGPNGIALQAQSVMDNGELDEADNDAIEAGWKNWGKKANCDVAGRLSWRDACSLFIKTVAQDGEAIVKIVTGMGEWGFSLQFIDPMMLPVDYHRQLSNGNFIKMGIEFNQYGKPLAYHFVSVSETYDTYTYESKNYIRVSANNVIHAFISEFPTQKRGVPWMHSAMARMRMLSGYEDAALVAARVGAAKMGFFTTPTGTEYTGDDQDADGNLIADAEAGTFEQLPQGVEFNSYDPQYPTGDFPEFMRKCLGGLASGLDVSYMSLSGDLQGVSFSSGRIGSLEERELWVELQRWMIDNFCDPIYEKWLRRSLLARKLTSNGVALPAYKIDKYMQVSWQGRRWQWVDPLKDENANKIAIDNGTKSVSQVIREQGRDPEEVFKEIAKDNERLEMLGINRVMADNTTQSPSPDEGDLENEA